jgi:hypothetical protein
MDELITITVPLEQAEALVDATNCLSVAAEGDTELLKVYMPEGTPEAKESDRYRRHEAELAQTAAQVLHRKIDDAYKRNPEVQEMWHLFKMWRKYGSTA